MPPTMKSVYSSNVTHVGHDPETSELHVTWKSGKTSVYEGVPADLAEQVRTSHSVGTAVREMIVPSYTHRYA